MKVKIACLQTRWHGDKAATLTAITHQMLEAVQSGAQLIVLPELCFSQYFCQSQDSKYFDLAEPIPNPTLQQMMTFAKDHSIVLVVPVFERAQAGIYFNTAVVIEKDGTLAGTQRKMHIPHDPEYNEKYYFTPGDKGFRPIATSVGKIGIMICFDQWFPESARLLALAGADILLAPTAIGWDLGDSETTQAQQTQAWMIAQRAHSVCNCLPLACANRVGREDHPGGERAIDFWGHSFIVDASGQVLVEGKTDEAIITATVDYADTEALRRTWTFLRDRRGDCYRPLMDASAAAGVDD